MIKLGGRFELINEKEQSTSGESRITTEMRSVETQTEIFSTSSDDENDDDDDLDDDDRQRNSKLTNCNNLFNFSSSLDLLNKQFTSNCGNGVGGGLSGSARNATDKKAGDLNDAVQQVIVHRNDIIFTQESPEVIL